MSIEWEIVDRTKKKRIVDDDLLETVRNLPCLACASIDPAAAWEAVHDNEVRSHPHHVISRGAGGDDVATNVMPLCTMHHVEIHKIGRSSMALKYGVIMSWLTETAMVSE